MNALPAFLQNRPSRNLAQIASANLGVGSPPYLSIMGGYFSLIDGVGEEIRVQTYDPKTGPFVDVIIIDLLERTSKIYYDKPYDPSAAQYEPPACFSDNGIAPSRNAARPQSPTCASCQWGMWGSKTSAVSGKGVKACNDIQKIAIMVAGYEMPFLLRVPPNSRTNLRNYIHKFQGQQVDVCDVVTRVSFEPSVLGTLAFAAISYIDEATFGQREKLLLAKATDNIVGRTDLPRETAGLPAPAAAPALAAPAQPAQPAPFVPAAAPTVATPSTNAAPSFPASAAQPAQPASPSNPPQQQRRRRRTNAEIAAAGQPGQQAPAQQAAPFMPQPAQASTSPAPAGNGAFGIQQGAAPNPELGQVLDNLFGKK